MEIEKIIDLKNELDHNLSKLIVEFENNAGMEISSVVIKREILEGEETIGVRTITII